MELQLKLCDKNSFPLNGILIMGNSVEYWLGQIQQMGFTINQVHVYPVPGREPNSVWGCVMEFAGNTALPDVGRNNFCQCIGQILFIPERTMLFPHLDREEVVDAGELQHLRQRRREAEAVG